MVKRHWSKNACLSNLCFYKGFHKPRGSHVFLNHPSALVKSEVHGFPLTAALLTVAVEIHKETFVKWSGPLNYTLVLEVILDNCTKLQHLAWVGGDKGGHPCVSFSFMCVCVCVGEEVDLFKIQPNCWTHSLCACHLQVGYRHLTVGAQGIDTQLPASNTQGIWGTRTHVEAETLQTKASESVDVNTALVLQPSCGTNFCWNAVKH